MKPFDPKKNNRLAILKRAQTMHYTPTPYKIAKKPPRFAWLARFCWWALHKLKALEPFFESTKIYTYTEADQEKVSERVHFAACEILDRELNPEDYAVVMGAHDFAELAQELDMPGYITVTAGEWRKQTYGGYVAHLYGLPVHVVAGLSGAALIPKVIIEKQVRK
jgi:hypothetical protein